jgi:hypothetical protein
MARVLISKATLADFGVPRQEVAVRQPMPTEQQISDAVLGDENMGLLSPEQYGMRMPLLEREKFEDSNNRTSEKHYPGEAGKKFLQGMNLEGALASGIAMREFPAIGMQDHHEQIPFLRDYFSRQTTLPEHDWSYHTEGPYYDEDGNILPGQVPPVNAVKLMADKDIQHIGQGSGFGLKPLPHSLVNEMWEKEQMRPGERFPAENIGFVGPNMENDITRNAAANVSSRDRRGYVGIRGFGRPSDRAFARDARREGREAGFTSAIPPERLVGAMPASKASIGTGPREPTRNMKPVLVQNKSFEQKLMEAVEEGRIPVTEVPIIMANQRKSRKLFPNEEGWKSFDAREKAMKDMRPFVDEIDHMFEGSLPVSWKDAHFGLENPILTDAEKENYMRQIKEQMYDDEIEDIHQWTTMDDWAKRNPVLHPKHNKVRFS